MKKKRRVGSKARELMLEQELLLQQMRSMEQPDGNNKKTQSNYAFCKPVIPSVSTMWLLHNCHIYSLQIIIMQQTSTSESPYFKNIYCHSE